MKKIIKKIKEFWHQRWEKHYQNKKYRLLIDIFLVILIIVLAFINYQASQLIKKIELDPMEALDLVRKKPQTEVKSKVDFQSKLELSIISEKNIISQNEIVPFSVKYKNTESSQINNLKIVFFSSNKNYKIAKLRLVNSEKFKFNSDGSLIVGQLLAGETGELDLTAVFEQKTAGTNQTVSLSVQASYDIGETTLKKTYSSAPIKVLSKLSVKQAVYYFSPQGDQLGVGPLPPKVDFPTTFWIFWEIKNFGNDLENFQLYGQLPGQVSLTGNKSLLAGNLKFSQSNQVLWTVSQVDKEGGVYKVGFEVEIMPNSQQVGKTPALMNQIEYDTLDAFCHQPIEGDLVDITTSQVLDRQFKSQGNVIK